MTFRIRPYRPADAAPLLAVFQDSVCRSAHEHYSSAQLAAWAPDQTDLRAWADRRASHPTWVAEAEGEAIGFIDLESDGHLDMLYVKAAFQGRGVASALLETVLSAARVQGLGRIFTEASLTAQPFFARHGFQVLGEQMVERHGQKLVNVRMEKPLREA